MDGECKDLIHPLDKNPYPTTISFSLNFHQIIFEQIKKDLFIDINYQ